MVKDHGPLWDFIATQPLAGTQVIDVPRRTARHPIGASQDAHPLNAEARSLQAFWLNGLNTHSVPCACGRSWTHDTPSPEGNSKAGSTGWSSLPYPVQDLPTRSGALGLVPRALEHRGLPPNPQKRMSHRTERQLGSAKRLSKRAWPSTWWWHGVVFHLAKLGRETPDLSVHRVHESSDAQ